MAFIPRRRGITLTTIVLAIFAQHVSEDFIQEGTKMFTCINDVTEGLGNSAVFTAIART